MNEKEPNLSRLNREWLVTNRLGAFAMGTPERIPKRKYHGLLNARTAYYEDAHHILAEVNEIVALGDEVYELGAFQYGALVYPRGFGHLESFTHDPLPTWSFRCGSASVLRTLTLHPDKNAVRLAYRIEGAPEKASLRLLPYFSCRSVHRLQAENAVLDGRVVRDGASVRMSFYKGFPELTMTAEPDAVFEANGFWNQRVHYLEERARGYPYQEDLFCPGHFEISFKKTFHGFLQVGLTEEGPPSFPVFRTLPPAESFPERLERAADAFLIDPAENHHSVIAGYPWFGEWGRDTFISFSGLTLARGNLKRAAAILDTYRDRIHHGLIPNILAKDPNEVDPNAIDASLWYIRAVQEYEAVAGPDKIGPWEAAVFELLSTMLHHRVASIHVRPSGLLYASSKPRPLTWMDARVDGEPVTPRSPFAVEVNALFYNAVRYALTIANRRKDKTFLSIWRRLAHSLRATFNEAFWIAESGYLADAHNGLQKDERLRPNQLLALALPFRPVSKAKGKRILSQVRQHLLTPFGLRTLSPSDPEYRGVCQGDQRARDLAYHQGTVWPWLLGPYVDAVLNVEGPRAAQIEIDRILSAFEPHLEQACLGQVSEIFDGDAPHAPRGAPAQAWSVAELLRIAKLRQQLAQKDAPPPKKKKATPKGKRGSDATK